MREALLVTIGWLFIVIGGVAPLIRSRTRSPGSSLTDAVFGAIDISVGQMFLIFAAAYAVFVPLVWWYALYDRAAVRRLYPTRAKLASLSPEQFERWCAARLNALGYKVIHVGGPGDHGVDLTAEAQGQMMVVQCKRYVGFSQVTERDVRELLGAMHDAGATRALVMTAGYFTGSARQWAKRNPVDLWDVGDLLQLHAGVEQTIPDATPCGKCAGTLVVRRNGSTGTAFYGCSRFPKCDFTRSIPRSYAPTPPRSATAGNALSN